MTVLPVNLRRHLASRTSAFDALLAARAWQARQIEHDYKEAKRIRPDRQAARTANKGQREVGRSITDGKIKVAWA